jgi:hypothetical protein
MTKNTEMSKFRLPSEQVSSKAHILGLALLGAVALLFLGLADAACAPLVAWAQSEEGVYLYQRGAPAAIPNFVLPEAGCNWTGVGGQVFDRTGAPVTGLVVKVGGTLEGQPITHYVLTGSSLQFGAGGYEITLADHLVTQSEPLTIQLLDISGLEKSPVIEFQIFADCQRNLRVINLAETVDEREIYFPLIRR